MPLIKVSFALTLLAVVVLLDQVEGHCKSGGWVKTAGITVEGGDNEMFKLTTVETCMLHCRNIKRFHCSSVEINAEDKLCNVRELDQRKNGTIVSTNAKIDYYQWECFNATTPAATTTEAGSGAAGVGDVIQYLVILCTAGYLLLI